jgi:uncharacterized membrane protein
MHKSTRFLCLFILHYVSFSQNTHSWLYAQALAKFVADSFAAELGIDPSLVSSWTSVSRRMADFDVERA